MPLHVLLTVTCPASATTSTGPCRATRAEVAPVGYHSRHDPARPDKGILLVKMRRGQ